VAEALTGVSATGARGTVTPRISIALTGVSASGAIGHMTLTTGPGESFNLAFPALVLAMQGVSGTTGELALTALATDLAMTGEVPTPGTVTLRASFGLAMEGTSGTTGELVLRTPTLAIDFGEEGSFDVEYPLPALTMAGGSGGIGQVDIRHLLPALAMRGDSDVVGVMAFPLRAPQLVMDMASGAAGTATIRAPRPALVMSGVTGTLGQLAIEQPLPELVLSGNYAATGVLALSTPAIRLLMEGFTSGAAGIPAPGGVTPQVPSAAATYVLQTERQALTRYTNFAFNSYAVFGGRVLGASPNGIFELTGDTDAGVAIQAAARFGVTDMNTSRIKRVDSVYVGYRTTAGASALLLRVLTNGTQQRDYAVRTPRTNEIHGTRVDLGKGVEARYWQFELRNRDGADFSLDTVEVAPIPMRRRLGVKDA
jgi:hypothetical protein